MAIKLLASRSTSRTLAPTGSAVESGLARAATVCQLPKTSLRRTRPGNPWSSGPIETTRDLADEIGFDHRIGLVARDDAGDAAAGGPDHGNAAGRGHKRGDRGRHGGADAMRDALQQKSLDREHAERQHDQDQQRQPAGVDPEKQAAEAVVAVGLERDVLADEFADREADQHRQQFDAAERDHDRGRDRERPHVGGEQNVANCTHCCDLILSSRAAISFSRCRRSSSSSSLSPSTLEAGTPVTRAIAAMARSALMVLVARRPTVGFG